MRPNILRTIIGVLVMVMASCGPSATGVVSPSDVASQDRSGASQGELLVAYAAYVQAAEQDQQDAWCRAQVGYGEDQPYERCLVELLGNGSTLLLTIVTECGGDSCGTRSWVRSPYVPELRELPVEIAGTAAASPRGDFLVFDGPTDVGVPAPEDEPEGEGDEPVEPFGGRSEIVLWRIDLPGFDISPFADCVAPVLSPAGQWFVCRDRSADVLKVAVAGGPLVPVASSGVAAEDVIWVWYAHMYPEPVELTPEGRLRFVTHLVDGEPLVQEIEWSE